MQVGDGDPPVGMADAMMMRGAFLRKLRQLEMADEAERRATGQSGEILGTDASSTENVVGEDQIDTLSNGQKMLNYDSFLSHQRYYDDLKHIDIPFIDYGCICGADGSSGGRLVIEQNKSLGKGGICWDAAFILGEYLIANEKEWSVEDKAKELPLTRLAELGSGTGLTGLMVAKACNVHVTVTDLPELLGLMGSNLALNFKSAGNPVICSEEDRLFSQEQLCALKKSKGYASAKVLRWGEETDYVGAPYDVVIGADIVASLYDPLALAQTFHALSGRHTRVFLSYKGRLTEPHKMFEANLRSLFDTVERIRPESRNKNPDVWILKAKGKKEASSCSS